MNTSTSLLYMDFLRYLTFFFSDDVMLRCCPYSGWCAYELNSTQLLLPAYPKWILRVNLSTQLFTITNGEHCILDFFSGIIFCVNIVWNLRVSSLFVFLMRPSRNKRIIHYEYDYDTLPAVCFNSKSTMHERFFYYGCSLDWCLFPHLNSRVISFFILLRLFSAEAILFYPNVFWFLDQRTISTHAFSSNELNFELPISFQVRVSSYYYIHLLHACFLLLLLRPTSSVRVSCYCYLQQSSVGPVLREVYRSYVWRFVICFLCVLVVCEVYIIIRFFMCLDSIRWNTLKIFRERLDYSFSISTLCGTSIFQLWYISISTTLCLRFYIVLRASIQWI